ncbi:hypothetical protein IWQ62_003829 [Dispira parvispora]|uniref:Protein kinase domain-containing protein n=1 Tax=Dispira parvispora TaxID=1520584 RepID=A0A9W8AMS5_9FUNG|nr:hypothetical protein IWQ62_003829 [Dispira parvispora]
MDYKFLGLSTAYPCDDPEGCQCEDCDKNDETKTIALAERNDQYLQFTFPGEVSLKEIESLVEKALTEENYEVIEDPSEFIQDDYYYNVEIPVEEGDNVIEPLDDAKKVNCFSRNEIDHYKKIQSFDSVPPSIRKFHGVTASNNLIQQLCLEDTLGSLDDYLENPDLPFDNLPFIRQIAGGLKFLHSHGIVHGDIGLCCIHLRTLDEPVISGFQCAHEVGGKPRPSREGCAMYGSSIWGGVNVANEEIGKTANDVYGLGSVIWSIATHREPYSHLSVIERYIAISEGKTEDLDEVSDPTLREIIRKCWEYCEIDPIIELLDKAIESSPKSS